MFKLINGSYIDPKIIDGINVQDAFGESGPRIILLPFELGYDPIYFETLDAAQKYADILAEKKWQGQDVVAP